LLDLAVSGAYGWGDLQLDHGFHDTPQGTRYTIGPAARTEVLDRLLELNHERHVAELAGAVPANTKRVARKAKATSDSGADVELTLFDPLFSSDSSGDGE
jgi:hypothetical protein